MLIITINKTTSTSDKVNNDGDVILQVDDSKVNAEPTISHAKVIKRSTRATV